LSRRRSDALCDRHIIERWRSPSNMRGSTGLSRGVPSRRMVATRRTPRAMSRSCAMSASPAASRWRSFHLTVHRLPRNHRRRTRCCHALNVPLHGHGTPRPGSADRRYGLLCCPPGRQCALGSTLLCVVKDQRRGAGTPVMGHSWGHALLGPVRSGVGGGDRTASRGRRVVPRTPQLFVAVEREGMGPQPDLVDHHRTHRDGVPARPRPLRLEPLGHCPRLVDQLGHAAGEVVNLRQELGTYASVWHPGTGCPAPGRASGSGHCRIPLLSRLLSQRR
jgi:hypothetical protein